MAQFTDGFGQLSWVVVLRRGEDRGISSRLERLLRQARRTDSDSWTLTILNKPLWTLYRASTRFSKALYSAGSLQRKPCELFSATQTKCDSQFCLLGHFRRINLTQPFPGALDGALKVLRETRHIDRVQGTVQSSGKVFEVESDVDRSGVSQEASHAEVSTGIDKCCLRLHLG